MGQITQSEWARRNGLTRQYVNKLVRSGRIKLINNKVDEECANNILKITADPAKSQRNISLKNEDLHTQYLKAKIHSETERAKILELERTEKSGSLISLEAVNKSAYERGRVVRDKILNIPDRISSLLVGIEEAAKIHEILTAELRAALEQISYE